MRKWMLLLIITTSLVLAVSCAKTEAPANAPHATVLMRDGTRYTGNVTATSPSEITLAGDDNTTHTLAMSQVKSISYDEPAGAEPEKGGKKSARVADTTHENHYHPDQAAIRSQTLQLPAGTELPVRTEETIDSAKAVEGQTYAAEISRDVPDADGNVAIPHGSNAQIVIRSASKGGRFRGASDLVLDLQSVAVAGQEYQLSTTDLQRRGRSGVGVNKRTAAFTGGGAAVGAIIGAIAGGGKGAAIGAGSGAGAGALTEVLTKGSAIRVPAETILTFKLDQPLQIVAAK